MKSTRRKFIKQAGVFTLATGVIGFNACNNPGKEPEVEDGSTVTATPEPDLFFELSLAQWSLNRSLFAGKLDNLDFAKKTKEAYGIGAVEYVISSLWTRRRIRPT